MFEKLIISDWIQMCGIFASLLTSIIAIFISIKTLRQNNKMIEESTRPVISIYSKYTNGILYIIIKNFGSSTAYIDSISCNHFFNKAETMRDMEGNIFDQLNGSLIAPNQKILCPFVSHKLEQYKFKFKIKYHSSENPYEESFNLDCLANHPYPDNHTSVKGTEKATENISCVLQDILKSQF